MCCTSKNVPTSSRSYHPVTHAFWGATLSQTVSDTDFNLHVTTATQLDWWLVDTVVDKLSSRLARLVHDIDLRLDLTASDGEHPELRSMITDRIVTFIQRLQPLQHAGLITLTVDREPIGHEELKALGEVFGSTCRCLTTYGLPRGEPERSQILAELPKYFPHARHRDQGWH